MVDNKSKTSLIRHIHEDMQQYNNTHAMHAYNIIFICDIYFVYVF